MARYRLEGGVRAVPLRAVIYGTEGIGKSTLASMLPEPAFIDVEGGTNQLDVARLPKPTSWTMLLDEVRAVRDGDVPCRTLVIDTADAAEQLCVRHLCGANQWESIETPGYGKGYTRLEEEFCRLLDLLTEVTERGRSVVLLSHAIMRKFERPDESGAYDRFELKLSKKVAPKAKEWCDLLLFLDYKIYVVQNKDKKWKASGGERVVRTSHAPQWDAKNRFALPDEMPLDEKTAQRLAGLMSWGTPDAQPDEAATDESVTEGAPESLPHQSEPGKPVTKGNLCDSGAWPERMRPLADLMANDGVTESELRRAVASKGYYVEECDPKDYEHGERDFCQWLASVWPSFMQHIETLRISVPFDEDGD